MATNGSHTYTVTASRPGCLPNRTATATVTVSGCVSPPPTNVCSPFPEAYSGNNQEIRNVALNGVTPGSYPLTISYRSHERTVDGIVRVNGVSYTVRFNQTQPGVYATVTTTQSVSLNSANTIGLSSGNDGGYVCFNNVCGGTSGGTPSPNCDFTIAANSVNASCSQPITLNATCNGTNCDNITYSWSGNGLSQIGQSVSFNAPGSNGGFTYTVTASRSGCPTTKTATPTVTVSGCGGSGGSLTPGCYVIKSQKTGQSLQAMSDGYINQQGGNGQTNQVWKAEDVGSGRYRFITQDGTNRVIKTNAGNYGDRLVLTGYTGEDFQKWSIAQNGTSGNYRVFASNSTTWDLANYGNNPELQLWGTTSEPFYDYRSFRFESTGCSGGTPPPPPTGGGSLAFQIVSYDCNSGLLQYRFNSSDGSAVSVNLPGIFGGTVNPNTVLSYTFPSDGRQGRTVTGTATQSGTQISINFTNGCGLSGGRQASIEAGSSTVGDGSVTTLMVTPNPTQGVATARFRLGVGEVATLSVTNMLGKTLHRKAIVGTGDEQTERIELEREVPGLYLIRLGTGKASYIGKVVLER